MSEVRFRVVLPPQAPRLAAQLSREVYDWCFLGTGRVGREKSALAFGPNPPYDLSAELTLVALRIKQPFMDWVARIGAAQRNPRKWLASRLASKSPLQSDLFLLCCYAELLAEWLEQDDSGLLRIAVVEDPWLLQVLRQRFRHDGRVEFHGGYGHDWLDAAGALAGAPSAIGRFLLWACASLLWAKVRMPCKDSRENPSREPAAWIYTWIEKRCFPDDADFCDPYTGRLEDLLIRRGRQVMRFTPLQLGLRQGLAENIRLRGGTIAATPSYLHFSDIAASLSTWFAIDDLQGVSDFGEWDCAPLLRRELFREWGSADYACCQLWFRAVCRLARAERGRISSVFYPFENQPWEKLLCLAFRQEAPQVRLIGYQHGIVSKLFLPYALGNGELGWNPLPDHVVANGELGLAMLRDGGFPPDRLSNGGAFRYEHLFQSPPRAVRACVGSGGPFRVLVVLPSTTQPASALLAALIATFPQPFIGDERLCRVEFVVKAHPLLPLSRLLDPSAILPSWFLPSQSPLGDLFYAAHVFLYAPATIARWEAYLSGLPVIKYQDPSQFGTLDLEAGDPIADCILSCSRDTLKERLEMVWREMRAVPQRPQAQLLVENLFSKVDEALWASLAAPQ